MKQILLLATVATFLLAHSGGTNSAGCHTNHKTGEYHCHKTEVDLLKCEQISKNSTTKKDGTYKKDTNHKHTHVHG